MLSKEFLSSKYSDEQADLILKTYENLSKLKFDSSKKLIAYSEDVAETVIGLKLDADSVCAALIFPFANEARRNPVAAEIINSADINGNKDIAVLVGMLSKCDELSRSYTDADGLKEMLIAITKDIRVIIIKIAQMLGYARTHKDIHTEKSEKAFKSIDDIFTPIAARLGLSEIKSELQDLSFYFHKTDVYKQLEADVRKETRANSRMISGVVSEIKKLLANSGIECTCYGRVKHLSSIYNKIVNKNYTLKNIYDISAVRILVKSVTECYAALGMVHSNFVPVDGRFKDYIANPKPNGYQSLHTTVYYDHEFFEVQIRTYDMHDFAEYGVAAHFLYKEHKKGLAGLDSKLLWIRKLLENKDEVTSEQLLDELKTDVYLGEIFVCTPKGKVIKLVENATPVDFAYAIHSDVGNTCVGAKVNGVMTTIFTPLENGDVVEILTSQNSKGPSRDWLKRVKTQQAKDKINTFFKKQMRVENIKLGKSMLESYAKSNDIQLSNLMQDKYVNEILKKSAFINVDELFASIGYGSTTAEKVVHKLMTLKLAEEKKEKTLRGEIAKAPVALENKSDIIGAEGTLTKYCKCCNPIPGDDIVGYVSRGRGIIIHRKDCENVAKLPDSRFIKVEWNISKENDFRFNSTIDLVAKNTSSVYVDVTNALGEVGVKVSSLNSSESKFGELVIRLGVLIKDKNELNKVKNKLNSLNSVYEVK